MEVEVKLSCWLKGDKYTLASRLHPTEYPVCAPPPGADPCSKFKWLLRREGQPFPISPDGAGCLPTPHSTKMTDSRTTPA